MNEFLASVNKLRMKRKQEAKLRIKKMLKDGKPEHCLRMDELKYKKKYSRHKIPKVIHVDWTKEEEKLILDYSKTSAELAKIIPHSDQAIQTKRKRLKDIIGLPRVFKGRKAK